MNEIIENVLAILATIFDMVILMVFYKTCMGSIRVNKLVFYPLYIVAFAVLMMLSQINVFGLFQMVKSFVIFFMLSFIYKSKCVTRIFSSLSYLAFSMLSELISYGVIIATMKNTSNENLQNYSLMLSKLILFVVVVTVKLIINKNTQIVSFKEYICFIITPMISIITLIVISMEFDTGKPNATMGICFAATGLTVINIIVYYLLENIIEANEIKERQSRIEQQFEYQEKKYEQISQAFKSINSVIHDTNKHLVYLRECIEHDDYDEAKRYIGVAKENIEKSYKRINTGYLPIDSLVSNAINLAETSGTKFKSDIRIEKERITIERYDLCVALGNLLDNAVEACKKVSNAEDKNIAVSVITTDTALVIDIENSAERMENPNFKTTKENEIFHGYGISNVRTISEKYGGVFTIERNEASCEAVLILPI